MAPDEFDWPDLISECVSVFDSLLNAAEVWVCVCVGVGVWVWVWVCLCVNVFVCALRKLPGGLRGLEMSPEEFDWPALIGECVSVLDSLLNAAQVCACVRALVWVWVWRCGRV